MDKEELDAFEMIGQWYEYRIISINEYTSLHTMILCDGINKMENIIYSPSLFNRMVERMEIEERLIKLPIVLDSLVICTIDELKSGEKRKSQRQLAEELGVSKATICRRLHEGVLSID